MEEVTPSLEGIQRAFRKLEEEVIPSTFEGYLSHLAAKPSRSRARLENSLVSLLPIEFLKRADPSLLESMNINIREIEQDKLFVREMEEIDTIIKPIPAQNISAVVLATGKLTIEKPRKRKSKRKRTKSGDESEPRSKKTRKEGTEEGEATKKKRSSKRKRKVA